MEDDNLRLSDLVSIDLEMSKIPSLIGPELQCLKFHYFLQEVSDTTNSRRPHTTWAFQILGTCKTYCNQISIWT